MKSDPIRDALGQVREIQEAVLSRGRFRGFSGRARIFSAVLALAAAALLGMPGVPKVEQFHLLVWGFVAFLAAFVNFGSLALWWWRDPAAGREVRRLRPAFEALPPLFVGALFTLVLVRIGEHRFLFALWMCLFGLVNFACQSGLPREVRSLSFYYLLCGAACALAPRISFFDPWPMGLVFFFGELYGGVLLHRNRCPASPWFSVFAFEGRKPV